MNAAVIEEVEEFEASEMPKKEEQLRAFYRDGFLRAKASYMEAKAEYKNAREIYEYNRSSYLDVCLKGTIKRISTKEKQELEKVLSDIVVGAEDDPIEISTDTMFDFMRLLMFGHM